MGCSASDLDSTRPSINTSNFCWSHHNFEDAYVEGKKYIFYKTKHHKRILLLRAWMRSLDVSIYTATRPDIRTQFTNNDDLIQLIALYITYGPQYETEGSKNEILIVESNTVTVLPSNGKRIYQFKSVHIQPYGVLTVTKWIDCDYHHNIGGILNIHCHGKITIDKHAMINLNGAGLTGLEDDTVLIQYAGYIEDEKAIELATTISKPVASEFGSYFIAKGGSYFKKDKKHQNVRKNIIYHGGIGGGSISLRCNDFINHGSVVANGTRKPVKVMKTTHNREMFYKLKYFAHNGDETYSGFNIKIVDIGMDGSGGLIKIDVDNDFVNKGKIEATQFGEIRITQTNQDAKSYSKLSVGNCVPFPKSGGTRKAPTAALL